MTSDVLKMVIRTLIIVVLAIGGLTFGKYIRRHQRKPVPPVATVSFLDISDGDCAVIRTADGRFIVVDTGGTSSASEVPDALRRLHATQIDLLVLASAADSAIGGIPALLASGIPIRSVWNNNIKTNTDEERRLLVTIRQHAIPIRTVHQGEVSTIGSSGLQLSVIWPPEHGDRAHVDALACRADYAGESCLFLGPISDDAEDYVLSGASDNLRSDVLQVTNHGDGEGTTHELLRRVQPTYAVIACNSADPPAPAMQDRLLAAGAATYRTDIQGTITVSLGPGANTPEVHIARQ